MGVPERAERMAAVLPTLHTAEPFFSAVARYAEVMRFPDYRILNESLYNEYAGRPAGELPDIWRRSSRDFPRDIRTPSKGSSGITLLSRISPSSILLRGSAAPFIACGLTTFPIRAISSLPRSTRTT